MSSFVIAEVGRRYRRRDTHVITRAVDTVEVRFVDDTGDVTFRYTGDTANSTLVGLRFDQLFYLLPVRYIVEYRPPNEGETYISPNGRRVATAGYVGCWPVIVGDA